MPIEFRCTKCGKLLRTPDDTGGRQARCPECGTILGIPASVAAVAGAGPSAAPGGEHAAFAPPRPASANPYQAPRASADTRQIAGNKIEFGDVYVRAWRIFRRRGLLCALVVVMTFALNYGLAYGLAQLRLRLMAAGGPATPLMATAIISFLFQWWLTSGQTYFFLNVAGGKPANIANLFAGSRWFLSIIAATILFSIVFGIGLVLLLVPGVIIGLMWSQYMYLIVGRDLGPLEALRASREIMRGNNSTLFAIYVVTLLPPMVGAFATAILAHGNPWAAQVGSQLVFLAIMPWFGVLAAVCHLIMSGQPTAEQARQIGNSALPDPEPERVV